MVKPLQRQGERPSLAVDHPQPGGGVDAADATQAHAGCGGGGQQPRVGRRRRGEQQFVVVATAQRAVQLQRARLAGQRRADRQLVDVDRRAHPRTAQHVAQVAGQAVAQVDGGGGQAAQAQPQRHPRLRLFHRAAHRFEVGTGQRDMAAEGLQRQPRVT